MRGSVLDLLLVWGMPLRLALLFLAPTLARPLERLVVLPAASGGSVARPTRVELRVVVRR